VILIGLSLLFPHDYNGAGMNIIEKAMNGEAAPFAFLLKMIFTAVTISAGFKGGEIVPTFFIGATFGCVFGGLLGLDPGFAAAVGLVCLFCGAVNCPVASIFLSTELFGGGGLLFFAIAAAFSFALSGYFGLYRSQKIMYSKTRAEFININAWQEIE
jgi:H+/Cl- antiporter ClcA